MASILLSAPSARRGGGITYIRNIVGAFPDGGEHRLSILSAAPIPDLPERENVEWIRAPAWTTRPIFRFVFGFLYFRFLWPRRNDFDAVYYAGGSFDVALPREVRRVVAFRNMVPFDPEARRRYPLGWTRFRVWALAHLQAWAFRRADLVIFISDYARSVIDRAIPHREGASVVIPHGAIATTASLNRAASERLPDRFVLYLSILDVYKAQIELVEAWSRLPPAMRETTKLVLAGPENPYYGDRVRATINQLRAQDDVILLGGIPHDQVSDLARRAALNLFLSSCENCPNILLELMCVGVPLLVADRQPMPELGGPDLAYVDPYDASAIAAAIERLLDDPHERKRLGSAALDRSRLYSWGEAGQRTWQAILNCARHSDERSNRRD